MEVLERHARTRAIIRDAFSPANQPSSRAINASRGVARVVSDVSVLCPPLVAGTGNADASAPRRGYASDTELKLRLFPHCRESQYRCGTARKARSRTRTRP